VKIALAQLNYHIGNFTDNTRKIKDAIARAKDEGADIVVFAELAVSVTPRVIFLNSEILLINVSKRPGK